VLQGLVCRDALHRVTLQEILEMKERQSGLRPGQLLRAHPPLVPLDKGLDSTTSHYTLVTYLQQVPPCGIELGHDIHQ
jgi:hypothetical protein